MFFNISNINSPTVAHPGTITAAYCDIEFYTGIFFDPWIIIMEKQKRFTGMEYNINTFW